MPNYEKLPVGKYGSKDNPGLEIIKYTGSKEQDDGSKRHGLLVKAISITRQQAETAFKAQQNANGMSAQMKAYILNPEVPNGTEFLNVVLHDHWANPSGAALTFGKKKIEELKLKVNPDDVNGLHSSLMEQASRFLSSEQISDGSSLEEAYQKILTTISINLGLLLRLEEAAGIDRIFNPSPDVWRSMVGTRFTGEVTETTGKGGKVYRNLRFVG